MQSVGKLLKCSAQPKCCMRQAVRAAVQTQSLLTGELTNIENALWLLGGHVVQSVYGIVGLPEIADHSLCPPPTNAVRWCMKRAVCGSIAAAQLLSCVTPC